MRVLYIDIDSLRPDHLGCYGYHRNTSPAIDRIAAEGLVCENVYTSDAPCLPSRTAFYSGRFGIQTGVVGHGATAAQPKIEGPSRDFQDMFNSQGLARQFQRLGMKTAVISPFGQRHAAWHFYAGFNEVYNTGQGGIESAEVVQPEVTRWLDTNAANDGWFLHVNFWDPHTPYRTPGSYENPFEHDPIPEWLDNDDLIRRHTSKTGPHSALDTGMYEAEAREEFPRHPAEVIDRKSMRQMIDGYDMAVRYVDDRIAEIVDQLKAAGVYEETLIILSADHGENLGELGIYGEHGTADAITCRVPMIIRHPGGVRGARDPGLHYNVDLAPTLMDLLGGETQPLWDGQSFADTVRTGTPSGREDLVVSQCCHVCQRSVLWDKWLYMRTYHDGFHLFPQEMLFDLESDPHEQNDLANRNPALCREGIWRLQRWHDAQMKRMAANASDVVDPLWTVVREGGPFHARLSSPGQPGPAGFKTYLDRLRKTGRAEGAAALERRYPSD